MTYAAVAPKIPNLVGVLDVKNIKPIAKTSVRAPRTAISVAVLCSDESIAIAAVGSKQAANVVTADLMVAILWPMLLSTDICLNNVEVFGGVGVVVVGSEGPVARSVSYLWSCRKCSKSRHISMQLQIP